MPVPDLLTYEATNENQQNRRLLNTNNIVVINHTENDYEEINQTA